MFDIGASELLLIIVVAILVIGPKDLPRAMRTAGRWIAKMRKVSGHFRAGIDAMIREAELEEMEKEWKARNAKIMNEHPAGEMAPIDGVSTPVSGSTDLLPSGPDLAVCDQADARATDITPASAEARAATPRMRSRGAKDKQTSSEPGLPFADGADGN